MKLCIFRERKYGASFCSKNKMHCGVRKLVICLIRDLIKYTEGGINGNNTK